MSCVQYLNFCYDDCMLKGLGLEGAGLDLDFSPDYIIGMNNRLEWTINASTLQLQNILLKEHGDGSIHASRCVTQPIYATVTDNYYAHNSMPKIEILLLSYNNQQYLIIPSKF